MAGPILSSCFLDTFLSTLLSPVVTPKHLDDQLSLPLLLQSLGILLSDKTLLDDPSRSFRVLSDRFLQLPYPVILDDLYLLHDQSTTSQSQDD